MSDEFSNRSKRRPIVAANWKMNTTVAEARILAQATADLVGPHAGVDVVLCPPAVSLLALQDAARANVTLGAQNMHWNDSGAFTGEISPLMLKDLCTYVLIGHSERRQYFGETDATVHLKVRAALSHQLVPIVCVGETLAQREAGETRDLIGTQVRAALHGLSAGEIGGLVVAYEPVWAIGTGVAASGSDANEVAAFIRAVLEDVGGAEAAATTRIQYGGSVNAANGVEFLGQPDIDGALVGGASLKPNDFAAIVAVAANT